ncbi:MAG: hypothetical protein AAF662_01970 [Pseudomonadota bacterium]
MLTEEGYQLGIAVYIGSALLALVLFNLWFLRNSSLRIRLLFSLPIAALLLTPALIEPGAKTLAPALVVAAFQFLNHGPEQGFEMAQHATRPLGLFTGGALVLGILSCALFRPRRAEPGDT